METPHVSKLWSDLMHRTDSISSIPNRQMSVPKFGVLSSCEGEVEELMKQIDIMVKAKKSQWDHEKGLLTTKIEQLEQDKLIQRATLERKHHEIGQLRTNLDGMERSQKDSVSVYERQMSTLKDQVHGMKSEYDRLQKRYHKPPLDPQSTRHGHVNMPEKRSQRSILDKGRDEMDNLDMKNLTDRIEIYRQHEKNWDQERNDLNVLAECLRSQNKALIEKCDSTSEQLSSGEVQLRSWQTQLHSCEAKLLSCESQLKERREQPGSSEVALKTRLAEVESRLQSSEDIVSSQETQLDRLKGLLNDAIQSEKRSKKKQDQHEINMKKSNRTIQKLEEERSVTLDKVAHLEQLLVTSQDDQRHLTDQIKKLNRQLDERDSLIHSLEGVKQDDHQLDNLRRQLNEAIEQLISSKNVEKTLKEEVSRLRNHVCQSVAASTERRPSDTKQQNQNSNHLGNETVDNQNENSRVGVSGDYQQRLEEMQQKIYSLEDELDAKNRYLEELERNHGVLSNYLTDVNHIIQNRPPQPNRNYNSSPSPTGRSLSGHSNTGAAAGQTSNSYDNANLSSQSSTAATPDPPSIYDTVDMATEDFRREQDAQSHLLESILDLNIDRLRMDTDATLLKYANNLIN